MGSNFSDWLKGAAQAAQPIALAEVPATVAGKSPPPEIRPLIPPPPPLAEVAPAPMQGEAGISGTPNWVGRIHSEANAKLQWERAFGTPGATQWGEWEKLHRTDHAVAVALGMLAAPLRDAQVEVDSAPDMDAEEAPEVAPPVQKVNPVTGRTEQDQIAGIASPPVVSYADPAPGVERPPPDEEPAIPAFHASRNEQIAEFVKDNFTKWLEPLWPTLIEQIVTYGIGYGFSLHEIVWGQRPDKRVPGGQAFYIKKLAQRLPSSVRSNGWREINGELACVQQSGVRNMPDGSQKWETTIDLPADKILLATWNRSGNNYQGHPAFRPGWYIGQIRADLLRILAIGSQRESCGVPVAEMDKDVRLTDPQRDQLQVLLENVVFHENAGFQLPPGVKINWIFSPGSNKGNVLQLWQALGTALMELVQAQQTTLGNNDTGSRAVGDVHAAAQAGFVEGVRAWIESALNGVGSQPYTGLVKKLVDVNFGPQSEYPKLKLVTKKRELDPTQFAGALKTLVDAGAVTLTDDDEDVIRERFGLPAVDPIKRQVMKDQQAAQKAAQLDAMKNGQMIPPTDKGFPPGNTEKKLAAFARIRALLENPEEVIK